MNSFSASQERVLADLLVTGGYLTECIVEKKGTGAMARVSIADRH